MLRLSKRCVARFFFAVTGQVIAIFMMTSGTLAADGFPDAFNTEKSELQPMSPEEAIQTLRLPEGFRATVFAAEPDVRQPISISFDARGRLWVAESYMYAESQVNIEQRLRDRLIVLEDRDHDGRFDQRTVFWDTAEKLTSCEVGLGGVWVLCRPQLLFLPDRDGDDVMDGPPEVILDGFDVERPRHNMANGLRFGPDGWLYGRQGILGDSQVTGGDTAAQDHRRMGAAIWRVHPTTKRFEIVAEGTTNPWGMDWNAYGEAFFINTVIGHLWHVMPGAHYRRMFGDDADPHVYRLIDQHADHVHWDTRELWSDVRKLGVTDSSSKLGGGHAHSGMMIYQGDNWPEEYRGHVFTVNYHGRRLNQDSLQREGSGYVGKHGNDLAFFADPYFRGVELMGGPDGGVWIADWSDTGECHDNDGVHRTSGRIYKITYGEAKAPVIQDVSKLTTVQLIELMTHANDWYPRQARLEFQRRQMLGRITKADREQLRKAVESLQEPVARLRAIWSLHAIEGDTQEVLVSLLRDQHESVRAWGIRFLVERARQSDLEPTTLERFVSLATNDPSALVRLTLASSLQRLSPSDCVALAKPLMRHSEDAQDHNLPLMLWYGVSRLGNTDPKALVPLALDCQIPLTLQCLSRRIAEAIDTQPEAIDALLVACTDQPPERQRIIMEGLGEAFGGWRQAKAPSHWDTVYAKLRASNDGAVRGMAHECAALFGNPEALREFERIALEDKEGIDARRQALQVLINHRAATLRGICERLYRVPELSASAATGLALDGSPEIADILLSEFSKLHGHEKSVVVDVLSSRPAWAMRLLDEIATDRIPRSMLSAATARTLRNHADKKLTARLEEVWGKQRDMKVEKTELLQTWKVKLAPEKLRQGNLAAGRQVFSRTCAACHRLFGEGAEIGPELTGAGRGNLDYLLENLLDPSAVVPANYRLVTVLMADGRVLSGITKSKTERSISLQTQNDLLKLDMADVEEMKPSELSLMAEGLLDTLTEEQARDLIAYLTSNAPGSP